MPETLFDKVWNRHVVVETDEATLLYIDRHLVHEVTSPQAFDGLRLAGRRVRRPDLTFATVDHNVPTDNQLDIRDPLSRKQVEAMRANCREFGVTLYDIQSGHQGIVHVIGPELGITLPGTTIVCGDSHTSTHGAFGALAFGIGTSEVEHVLATQTLWQGLRPSSLGVEVTGRLIAGARAQGHHPGDHPYDRHRRSDRARHRILRPGDHGPVDGRADDDLQHVDRGRRPRGLDRARRRDDRIHHRRRTPVRPARRGAWKRRSPTGRRCEPTIASAFDRHVPIDAGTLVPQVTWGTNPAMTVDVTGVVPDPEEVPFATAEAARRALEYMGLEPGTPISEIPVDVVFIGSCTNGRIEDLRAAAQVFKGRKTAPGVQTLVVPGSEAVRHQAEAEGLDRIFLDAGAEWRQAGCSMCLAMNPDRLKPGQRSASTSNRNFEGRQGPGGRTHLVSPAMAAAAAVTGHFTDVRQLLDLIKLEPTRRNHRNQIDSRYPTIRPAEPTRHGTIRHTPRSSGRARLDRRQHRPDHPGAVPEEGRAHRLWSAALRRQALCAGRGTRGRRRRTARCRKHPTFPSTTPRSRVRPSSWSDRTSAAARAASTRSGP